MRLIATLFVLFALVGCGSSSDQEVEKDTDQVNGNFVPRNQEIQTLTLLDASGAEISGANVLITEVSPQANALAMVVSNEDDILVSDENGHVLVEDLAPGLYQVTVELEGVEVNFFVRIEQANAIASATVLVPLSVIELEEDEIEVVSLMEEGVFFSLSGLIYDGNGPVSGAQVSLSAGAASNGAINTGLSNQDGEFSLIINVGSSLEAAMEFAAIRIVKDGYDPVVISNYDALSVVSVSGLNVMLSEQDSDIQPIYMESFNVQSDQGVCGSWISDNEITMWHQHGASLGIQNQAYEEGLVVLAPGDTSEGYVPDPYEGYACWYGEPQEGGVTQGNFLGDLDGGDGGEPLAGGTSYTSNDGAIISPEIDLTGVSAPISLHFKTWWEIESVNPNKDGYDVMEIEYTNDEGETWYTIARLNPLSDPVDGFTLDDERAPYSYSNNGFNKAPGWTDQEPIPLDALANQVVRLRLTFSTVDEKYNGFRGWLIDDIAIYPTQGTFPLYEDAFLDSNSESIICEASDEQDLIEQYEDGVPPVGCPSFLE